ncbi:MAG: tRNA (guanosine(37)-N1)-methyltransferase TrmD [Candidatus Magasanikbacteria bacterium]|nr:tRNA (guanosine(37)-N1)-methyltransferase TrmD [Candidatus Magasanikbacteria bacterium]
MKFNTITIFPSIISNYCNESILGRAQKNNYISVNPINLRDFATDQRKTIDDTPYGGGAGMVMKPEPIYSALQSINAIPFSKTTGVSKIKKIFRSGENRKKRTILLSPRGREFTQTVAEELSQYNEITFVCGRYEGVDQRVADFMVDEEMSVGKYVLAGGELGALIIIEAVSRLIPGVLGNPESLSEETFSVQNKNETDKKQRNQKEYPQYTKPEKFLTHSVPAVLLSGDHAKIKAWRKNNTKD